MWKRILFYRMLLVLTGVVLPSLACAQQSFFNVPSSQKTEKNRHFSQFQFNRTRRDQVGNFTYDYGLGESFEVGFNVLGVSDRPRSRGGESTDFMLNGQYFWELRHGWGLSAAAQAGISQENELAVYGFINARKEFESEAALVFGVFYGNEAYLEQGQANFHLGAEVPIIKDRLNFVGDYISGTTSISVGVLGLGIYVTPHFILSMGAQYPSFRGHTDHGVVFEFTYYNGVF